MHHPGENSGYRPDINGYKPCRHLIRLQLLLREGCLLVAHPARRMLPSPGLTAALRSAQTHSPSGPQSHSCSGSRSSLSPGLSRTLSRCFSAEEKLLLTPKWCCLHVLLVQPNCHGDSYRQESPIGHYYMYGSSRVSKYKERKTMKLKTKLM